jgi:quinoprotein glucose dehydrogenase
MKNFKLSILPLLFSFYLLSCNNDKVNYKNWEVYGGSKNNIRYSSLTQIDTNNIMQLEKAWEFKTGDTDKYTQIQVNPIIVDQILYGVSPKLKLFAVNAATGKSQWVFDPYQITEQGVKGVGYFAMNVCRGVTYYKDKDSKRVFYAAGANLFCVDANTGKLIKTFGDNGKLDLHNDLDRDVADLYIAMTSPGIIYKDMIIIGSRVNENAAAAPGYIRAYDVHTGKLKWKFHTIPKPGEEGYDSWEDKEAWKNIGGVNAWAGFSLDEKRGIVYAPLGSASYDFYGGKRLGANLFANSILALDAATGKKVWHFQTVHHDVWDRDLPTAPALVTITKEGKQIDALAQPTKTGFVFLLDRTNGKPIYPINEVPVPTNTELVGEKLSSTQPWPTVIEPFVRQAFTEKDVNNLITKEEQTEIKNKLAKLNTGFMFNPSSKNGTVIFPGFDGGAEWGGPAYDPATQLLYINANEMPWILTMIDQKNELPKKETNLEAGMRLYKTNCMACHGPERKGGGNYPGLINVDKKYTETNFVDLLTTGRRMMPAFTQLNKEEKEALASFILSIKNKSDKNFKGPAKKLNPYWEMPYTSTGYNKFLTKEGYPAVTPPWGSLNAINLNTGKIAWKVPLGETSEFLKKGIHTGTENYGGPAVTAGGVLFIAATKDSKFRAYNKRTGKLIWETTLPYPGFATPAVYEVNGKQFVVIACGGGKLGTASGDVYIAYALSNKK